MNTSTIYNIIILVVIVLLIFKSALDSYTIGKLVYKVKELGEKIK